MLTRNAEQVLRIFLILAKMRKLKLRLKQKRRFWVRKLYLERHKYGLFESSLRNLAADEEQFNKTLRMPFSLFNVLHEFLEASLTKYSIRTPISSRCRLFITLIYLAHGGTRQLHTIVHQIGLTTFRKITLETCMTIWDLLADCVGSIDGKHINITCPANSGSMYYNYKGNYSIVLLAVCDANYTFTCVDIGAYGSQSDGGVYHFSKLADAIENDRLGLPHDQPLPGETEPFPHYLVGDAAFPLRRYLMRPYPGRGIPEEQEYFNKRLSRARRVIENAFGILTAKWRILRTTLCMAPKNAEQIVIACIVLHNFIKLPCAN
ncbi:protein ALP1-like [Rhagoletis pomonella]|uniref:protein ALP1-like n=1 Tax=Rhagoletis pomonella TaxID=28610 RepID=UPI00177AAC47|nr:protein ALP1-like [Rhagoletis pomonella]